MANETLSRIIGSFVGAALVIAGLAAFAPQPLQLQPHVEVHSAIDLPATAHLGSAN